MDIAIVDAQPDHPPEPVADLIWTVDVALMTFLFGTRDRWRRVFAYDWPAQKGIVCHRQTSLAMRGEETVGVLVSHRPEDFDDHFAHTRARQGQAEGAAFRRHLDHAFDLMEQLFPHPLEGSYFVFDLAVSETARHMGVGRRLLEVAIARGRAAGRTRICLDVAAENDAVRFYQRIGMNIAVETRIPELAEAHGVGVHYHMVLPI